MNKICMIQGCARQAATRGLCLVCYSKAKKKVDEGATTWESLVKMGLCEKPSDPFDDAYNRAMEDQ